ncbi:MAG TPA: YqcC family protein [Kofleriaceae bacterium]|nr:YqcC family protein [Kofleriaceae bacterium]
MPREIDAAAVRARLDDVIAAMRREGCWDLERPSLAAFDDMGAFGTRTMAFPQWLRWVFVPNVEHLLAAGGPWPAGSQVAVQAAREGDSDEHVAALVPALSAFDALFASDEAVEDVVVRLRDAAQAQPGNGTAWASFAMALDAAGDEAGACAALASAIACGNAADDAYLRDRRVQLELIIRARGVRPPPPPPDARPDTAALDVLAAAMVYPELATGRTFFVRPTVRAPLGEIAFAVICVIVDGRALPIAIVEHVLGHTCLALTLTRAGDAPATFRRAQVTPEDARTAAEHLADWVRGGGPDPSALNPIEAALALRDALGPGWRLRAGGDAPAQVLLGEIGTTRLLPIRARAGGGVIVSMPDEELELATPAEFVEAGPLIVGALRRAQSETPPP